MGRRHQGMDRPGVCQVPEGSGEQWKMEETDCEVICIAPKTLSVNDDDDDDDDDNDDTGNITSAAAPSTSSRVLDTSRIVSSIPARSGL